MSIIEPTLFNIIGFTMTGQAYIYISLGFFAASLLAVLLSKFVFSSAYKKAAKQYRGQIPLNQAEMNAERDRLRAEFAINLNKLEYKVAAMQQSELELRVEATKATEHKQRTLANLTSYIKKAVRWEAAHDHSQNMVNILEQKLKLQDKTIEQLNLVEAENQIENKRFEEARLNYQIADAKYLKLKNEQDLGLRELKNSEWQLNKVTSEFDLQSVELQSAKQNNLTYEAKISEISTQMLFLSQELFAKKISLDLSERSIDKYKNKLLTQKLQMRDASLKDKAIYAVKTKLNGTADLDLDSAKIEPSVVKQPKIATLPGLAPVRAKPQIIEPPKLVHTAPKSVAQKVTGLRDRMNSLANGTDD